MSGTDYPNGISSRGIPLPAGGSIPTTSGNVFHVSSTHPDKSDGNDGARANRPLATLDAAIAKCTANHGDMILVKENHAEDLEADEGVNIDVEGITIIGLGIGEDRPTFTFTTAVTADFKLAAKNTRISNLLMKAGIDALTGPIEVSADDCQLWGIEWRDDDTNNYETTDVLVTTGTPLRLLIDGFYFEHDGGSGGTQMESVIQLNGADGAIIRNSHIIADCATGVIEDATVSDQIAIDHSFIENTSGSVVAVFLQATTTGHMRFTHMRIASGLVPVTADNDMSFHDCWASSVDGESSWPVGQEHFNIGVWPTAAAPADGVSLPAALRTVYDEGIQRESIGTADIDDDAQEYTAFQNLITITPAGGAPMHDVTVHIDLDKATSGFVAVYTTSRTIQFAVARKVNGTDWRRDVDSETTARAHDLAGLQGITIKIGSVGPNEEARIEVKVSAEEGTDVELPFVAYYRASAAATITPVAAG